MPRLRPKREKGPARFAPRTDVVFATTDIQKGARFVGKGDAVRREDAMVLERPDLFEVRYPLLEEVKTDA